MFFWLVKNSKATRAIGTEYAACITHTHRDSITTSTRPADWPAPEAEKGCSQKQTFQPRPADKLRARGHRQPRSSSQSTPGTGQKRQSGGKKERGPPKGEQGRGLTARPLLGVQVDDDVAQSGLQQNRHGARSSSQPAPGVTGAALRHLRHASRLDATPFTSSLRRHRPLLGRFLGRVWSVASQAVCGFPALARPFWKLFLSHWGLAREASVKSMWSILCSSQKWRGPFFNAP